MVLTAKPPLNYMGNIIQKSKFSKWVRPDKVDGKYLPEISGKDAVWNWRPA